MHILFKIGIWRAKRFMKKNNITDLSEYPNMIPVLNEILFFVPEKDRAGLIFGLSLKGSMM